MQKLKSTHQFVFDNDWQVAWKLKSLPDSLYNARVAFVEIEAIVGELRVEDDVLRRSKQAGAGKEEKEDS